MPRLVAALDRSWSQIRARHADVLQVVITLGSGTDSNGPPRWGPIGCRAPQVSG